MSIAKNTVKIFAEKVPWNQVIPKAGGAKQKGDRLWPTKSGANDQNLNFRFDKGSTDPKTGEVELILQANREAADTEVKKAAQQSSHTVVAKVKVNPKEPDGEKATGELMASFSGLPLPSSSADTKKTSSESSKQGNEKGSKKGSGKGTGSKS